MAKTARKMAMAIVAGAVLAAPQVSAAADATAAEPITVTPAGHVRSESPIVRAAIQQAMERSATFRSIVATIDASDSYVYVSEGHCGHGVRACFVSVTAAGPNRMMWVKLDTRKADWDLMGSIAHELRHTIEVIGVPSIRDNARKYFFYQQIGIRSGAGAQETQDAITAGNTVRSEVRQFNRQLKSE
jgi:hypothetical protein